MAKDQKNTAFRIEILLTASVPRLDGVLLEALRKQNRNLLLKNISRAAFKLLFKQGKIKIKGQNATPSSAIAQGSTWVDITGFEG